MDKKILLLCKETLFCKYAIKIIESYYLPEQIHIVSGKGDEPLDAGLSQLAPEYLISFLSPWIIPESLLAAAQKAAINFHPDPPEYPGSGCYGFAIHEQAKRYGVTCHHMAAKVDTGDIIQTVYFDISPLESVETLKLKSMNHLLALFSRTIQRIYKNEALPMSGEKWLRPPSTLKQFEELKRIDPATMDTEEILLRIRATDYSPSYESAYIDIGGKRFSHLGRTDEPLV